MLPVTNDMPTASMAAVRWTKSSHSNPNGNCMELARLAAGKIAVRNSRHPGGPTLVYSHAEMTAFVVAVKGGEFGALAT